MNYIKNLIKYSFLFLAVLTINGCDLIETIEISRLKSPDSMVEAVLIRTNAGATTSYGYHLYIIPFGKKIKNEYEVFRADRVDSLDIYWKENNFLEIKFKKAQIFNFKNFWFSKEVQNYRYIVEIRLMPLDPHSLQGY